MSSNRNQTQLADPVVKICGIRTADAALAAKASGAEIIGMIFAPSPRLIDIATAQGIARAVHGDPANQGELQPASILPHIQSLDKTLTAVEYFAACASHIRSAQHRAGRPLLAGVFQNQPLEHILHVARSVPLDLVQLHGVESADLALDISVPVIKVFHVDESMSADADWPLKEGVELLKPFRHSVILLDTKVAGTSQQGGRGVSFDWNIARALANTGVPFLMAGGLTPENVKEAVEVGGPWGVDVSSGIETEKAKDPNKIQAFVANAKK
ncbi:N-anthranilate isomerase [Martensiomyces pterosporus]|nr:N-anthranilate isomerase [Martensiomyces pterosporus]